MSTLLNHNKENTSDNLHHSAPTKSLSSLTPSECIVLLEYLGCIHAETTVKQLSLELNGEDLQNIEAIDDLVELGFTLPKVRLRTIVKKLEQYKLQGVSLGLLNATADVSTDKNSGKEGDVISKTLKRKSGAMNLPNEPSPKSKRQQFTSTADYYDDFKRQNHSLCGNEFIDTTNLYGNDNDAQFYELVPSVDGTATIHRYEEPPSKAKKGNTHCVEVIPATNTNTTNDISSNDYKNIDYNYSIPFLLMLPMSVRIK